MTLAKPFPEPMYPEPTPADPVALPDVPNWTRFSARSRPATRRSISQDAYLADPRLNLFAVCDGVRGRPQGATAARIALTALHASMQLSGWLMVPDAPAVHIAEALMRATRDANRCVVDEARRRGLTRGMATTLAAAVVLLDFAIVVNAGDSRVYVLNRDSHRRLTRDHSLAEQCAALGVIDPSEVAENPMRNILTRFVGSSDGVDPDVTIIPLSQGDRLLLCTDGLWSVVDESAMLHIAAEARDLDTTTGDLLALAQAPRRPHDVTVVLAERVESPIRPE